MSKVISKIVQEISGVVSYLNASDERIASTSAQVSCVMVSDTGIEITDGSGEQVFITSANITAVNGVAFSGTTQELWTKLDTEVFQTPSDGGGGAGFVASSFDNSQIGVLTGGPVANFPALTQTFEAGNYLIKYYGMFTATGPSVRGVLQIEIPPAGALPARVFGVEVALGSTNRVPAVNHFYVQLSGSETINFIVNRGGNIDRLVFLQNRYYTIEKIS